ncbi:MAG: DUF1993 domain-containing protein [Steroidobacteraceae bacterium]
MSMSNAALSSFEIGLNALASMLDKAEAHAAAKKIDVAILLNMRLFPDMFPFTRQVQIACDAAKNGGARLAGVEPPKHEDTEQTIAELKARITKTIAFVKTLDQDKINGSTERAVIFPMGRENKAKMRGVDYFNHFVLPNFYFHISTAYGILRHSGVELGKRDYLAGIPMTMV